MTQEELILKYAELKKENEQLNAENEDNCKYIATLENTVARLIKVQSKYERLKEGIEMVKAGIDNSRTISLTHNTALDECLSIIDEYLGEVK